MEATVPSLGSLTDAAAVKIAEELTVSEGVYLNCLVLMLPLFLIDKEAFLRGSKACWNDLRHASGWVLFSGGTSIALNWSSSLRFLMRMIEHPQQRVSLGCF